MDIPLELTADVPQRTIEAFGRACSRFKDEVGNTQAVAVRRGTIALIRSLRARTAKAPKMAPAKDVSPYNGPGPHYVTPKGKKQKPLRRYAIVRRGGDQQKTYIYPATSKAEARREHGQYLKWGLARKSWGWFMAALFNRSAPTDNPKATIDQRMTEGYLREIITGPNPHVEVHIVNKLNYIRAALPSGALEESMQAATNSINRQIDDGIAKARRDLD